MKTGKCNQKYAILQLSILMFFSLASFSESRTITQLIPTLTISEEYSDNYFKTKENKQEEFITAYELGFSLGFLNPKSKIYLNYNPIYEDYKNLNDRDGFEQEISLDGIFTPSKRNNVVLNLSYTTNDDEESGETWENSAFIEFDSQLTKNTDFYISHLYKQSFDQQVRTGIFNENEENETSVSISNQFGQKDRIGLDFVYGSDDYKNFDEDNHKEYSLSGFITYWFRPLNGIDSNLAYEKTDFDNSSNEIETYSGHIRYIRKFKKNFDGFIRYRHSFSERESGDHHVFHPSVGFDWQVSEDTGVSLGFGVLINDWDNENSNSTTPFIDMDVYKIFDFSRRGSLSITASSGYDQSSDDAASLGYTLYYKAGFRLKYQLQKRLSSNLFGSFTRDEFEETEINRNDNTINLGAGLSWDPLRWLRFDLSYYYERFDTDSSLRDDYSENKGILSVSFIPSKPVRIESVPTRSLLESEIF